MSSTHPVPLKVKTTEGYRNATDEELAKYLAKGGPAPTKWQTANRIALAKKNLQLGMEHGPAWTDAFNTYPQPESQQKPRFILKDY